MRALRPGLPLYIAAFTVLVLLAYGSTAVWIHQQLAQINELADQQPPTPMEGNSPDQATEGTPPAVSSYAQAMEALLRDSLLRFVALALLFTLLAAAMAVLLFYAPLKRMIRYLEGRRHGTPRQGDVPLPEQIWVRELHILAHSLLNYEVQLEDTYRHLESSNRELWRLAHQDSLSGIANRRAYEEHWQQLQKTLSNQRVFVSVMLIDCDRFKAINDTYGHDVGDKVIKMIARVLHRSLRDGDKLFRIGGDEFAVHLINTDQQQSRQLAERFHENLRAVNFRRLGIVESVEFSIGIACANGQHPKQLTLLHRQADIAMYQAKRPGSGKIVVYDEELTDQDGLPHLARFIQAIHHAIEQGEGFEFHFQPIISTRQDGHGYYEILCRLRDARGLIQPRDIFPVVDTENLAFEFDQAILRHLLGLFEQRQIPVGFDLAINIHGKTLTHPDFLSSVRHFLPHLQKQHCRMILEINEQALMLVQNQEQPILQQLRDEGFLVALDNFGSRHSPLHYLTDMAVDIVKLDREVIHYLANNRGETLLGELLAKILGKVGYQLVAAGVESPEQLARVVELKFNNVQGFLFGQPTQQIAPQSSLQLNGYPLTQPKTGHVTPD